MFRIDYIKNQFFICVDSFQKKISNSFKKIEDTAVLAKKYFAQLVDDYKKAWSQSNRHNFSYISEVLKNLTSGLPFVAYQTSVSRATKEEAEKEFFSLLEKTQDYTKKVLLNHCQYQPPQFNNPQLSIAVHNPQEVSQSPLSRQNPRIELPKILDCEFKTSCEKVNQVIGFTILNSKESSYSTRSLIFDVTDPAEIKMNTYSLGQPSIRLNCNSETEINENFDPIRFKSFLSVKGRKVLRFNLNDQMKSHFYSFEIKPEGKDVSYVHYFLETDQPESINELLETNCSLAQLFHSRIQKYSRGDQEIEKNVDNCLESKISHLDLSVIRGKLNIVDNILIEKE